MKRGKFASLKQKIICIPIIIVTLISFIIPNYAHADVGQDVFNIFEELLLLIPDAIINGLENFFLGNEGSVVTQITDTEATMEYIGTDNPVLGWLNATFDSWFDKDATNNAYAISNIMYTPKLIFSNMVPSLDANFFSPSKSNSNKNLAKSVNTQIQYYEEWAKKANADTTDNTKGIGQILYRLKKQKELLENPDENKIISKQLKNVIATWYVALRNLVLVGMLIVLVYIGIKIMMTTVAGDKAKYKQLLVDWIVGICLILFIHYLMVFMVNVTEVITNMLITDTGADNLVNQARIIAGQGDEAIGQRFWWGMIYLLLVFYTLMFTWQYLKRIVKLAILTLFAPIIAASYPIDKMTDGQAQGYNRWFKDYIYTLLMQPLHLVVYTVLISSVSSLAQSNALYSLVVLSSLLYIEKMLREYLGFEKGHVKPPNPAGLLAAATLGKTAISTLLPSNVKNKSGKGSGGDSLGDSSTEKPIDTSRGDNPYALLAGGNDKNEENGKGKQDVELLKNPKDEKGKGYGNGPISDKQEDWDALRAAQKDAEMARLAQQKKKRNIRKPTNLKENIASIGKKISNSKFARGVGAVGRKYARKLTGGKTGIRGIAHIAARTARVGTGLLGAGLFGAYGTAMGLAMDDPSKIAQLGLGGLASGYAGGSKLVGAATGLIGKGKDSVSGVASTYKSAADPAGYEKKIQEKEQKRIVSEIRDNEAAMRMFRMKNEHMSDKDIVSGINECVSQGIDNIEDIQKVFDLQEKAGIDKNTAIGAVKISKGTNASELRNEGKTEDLRRSIQNNISGPDAEKQSYDAIDILRKIHKVDLMDSKRSSYAEAMEKQKKTQGKKPEPVKPRNEGQGSSKKGSTRRSPRMK